MKYQYALVQLYLLLGYFFPNPNYDRKEGHDRASYKNSISK